MSFSVTGSTQQDAPEIAGDGFFPAISPSTCRDAMRLDGTITPERLRNELIEAIITVNDQLEPWKQAQLAADHLTLDDVPAVQVDGASKYHHRYTRAVYCLAAASLNERYKAFDTTNAGNQRGDENEPTIDDLRRDAYWAISDILARPRTVVELV